MYNKRTGRSGKKNKYTINMHEIHSNNDGINDILNQLRNDNDWKWKSNLPTWIYKMLDLFHCLGFINYFIYDFVRFMIGIFGHHHNNCNLFELVANDLLERDKYAKYPLNLILFPIIWMSEDTF